MCNVIVSDNTRLLLESVCEEGWDGVPDAGRSHLFEIALSLGVKLQLHAHENL